MMIHGPDFRLAWSTPHDLGWKAAASNLSDIAAMGAVPTALVVAIAAPADSPVTLLEGIADGLRDACAALAPGCGVVGGDLSVSPTLTIAVTAFGDLEGRPPVLRSGARVGDIVAVAGVLGEAAAALSLLFTEAVDPLGHPDSRLAAALRMRTAPQLAPTPPIFAGRVAAFAGATAMLDLSDGLAIDSARLARASGLGIDFELASLGARGADPALALGGGEDHSLLATFPAGTPLPAPFRRIGSAWPGRDSPWTGRPTIRSAGTRTATGVGPPGSGTGQLARVRSAHVARQGVARLGFRPPPVAACRRVSPPVTACRLTPRRASCRRDSGRTEQRRTEQRRPALRRTELSRTELSRTEQHRAEQRRTELRRPAGVRRLGPTRASCRRSPCGGRARFRMATRVPGTGCCVRP